MVKVKLSKENIFKLTFCWQLSVITIIVQGILSAFLIEILKSDFCFEKACER